MRVWITIPLESKSVARSIFLTSAMYGLVLSDHLQVFVLVLSEHFGDGHQFPDGGLRFGQDL